MAWQFAPGEILTSANLNAVTRPWNALCQLVQSSTQSITNNTSTPVTFNSEDLDPLSWHSTVSLTERVVPTIAGWYRVTAQTEWQADTDYTRILVDINKNAAAIGAPNMRVDSIAVTTAAAAKSIPLTSPLISLNGSTDYISLVVFQVNTSAGANTVQCRLLVELVYPT